jgi:transcriptional regulator with XRE-family HTH domain
MYSVDSQAQAFMGHLPRMARRPVSPTHHEAIAQRLRLTREATGLPQRQFARRVGITPAAWNNYEKDVNRISVDAALKLCASIGATLDWIYRGNMESGLPMSLARKLQELQQREEQRSAA